MGIKDTLNFIDTKFLGKRIPYIVGWGITNRCNKSCSYCSLWKTESAELGTEQVLKIIDELAGLGTRIISFTGGEPLLRHDIGLIIDHAADKGIKVKLNSNGSLVKDKINEIKNICVLNLSFDGDQKVHDSIRGTGSYDETIHAAKTAKENGIDVTFTTVLSKANAGSLDFILEKAKELGVKVLFQPVTEKTLGKALDNPVKLDDETYRQAINKLIALKTTNANISNTITGLRYLLDPRPLNCACGYLSVRIEPNGDVLHCSRKAGASAKNCVKDGMNGAFYGLKPAVCSDCLCSSRTELNLLWSLDMPSIFERLTSDKLVIRRPDMRKPTRILGISDNHGASAAIIEDGRILAAIEEERLNRNKAARGMPLKAINECLKIANLKPQDIDLIAVAGKNTPNVFLRNPNIFSSLMNRKKDTFKPGNRVVDSLPRKIYKNFQVLLRYIPLGHTLTEVISGYFFKKALKGTFSERVPKIVFYDHHLTHAYAYFFSGFNKALTITLDNQGDGISTGIYKCNGDKIELIASSNAVNSLGYFYQMITMYLGFNPVTDTGKTVGLAAYGKPLCYDIMKKRVYFNHETGKIANKIGLNLFGESVAGFIKVLDSFKKEDVASSVQKLSEDIAVELVKYYVNKTGYRNIVLSGGVAYNIKINQRVQELDCVNELFAFPICGDNGLSVLAAFEAHHTYYKKTLKNNRMTEVYWGPSYSDEEVKKALDKYSNEVSYTKTEDSGRETVNLLCEGKIVWRFQGNLEFGPRALGHRSILALASNAEVNKILNDKLQREHFMPFCPSMTYEHAYDYLKGDKGIDKALFMITGFDVKEEVKAKIPAVVHVDGTARPQIVRKDTDERFWNIINGVYKRTGQALVLNTSFNMHGEPIVCTPEDAVKSFLASNGEYLAIENYLVTNCKVQIERQGQNIANRKAGKMQIGEGKL